MEKSLLLILAVLFGQCLARSQESTGNLQCYSCANVEVKTGFDPFGGKSDPTCGVYPTSSNTKTCYYGEVCGSISGDLSLRGVFDAKVQIRGCIPGEGTNVGSFIGGCVKSGEASSAIIAKLISFVTNLPGVKFNGIACSCNFDYCALCDGGLDIAGYCMKYWIVALTAAGLITAFILLVTCCCCCCTCCCCYECCNKKRQGVVYSIPYRTVTMVETPQSSLSVQSGDITRQPTNQGATFGGIGFPEDRQRAGYNQGDAFGHARA